MTELFSLFFWASPTNDPYMQLKHTCSLNSCYQEEHTSSPYLFGIDIWLCLGTKLGASFRRAILNGL